MRIVFLGSGAFGLPTLRAIRDVHDVVLVVTQPDRPAGRGRHLTPTPIGAEADAVGLEVIRAEDANAPATVDAVHGRRPDVIVVIAFGQKLGPRLLEGIFSINLHASLLPRYRGAAPINWAMIRGEERTGISVITVTSRMDGGEVLDRMETPIDPLETAGELHDRLALMGPDVVLRTLARFEDGTLRGGAQDESLVTKAPKLTRADTVIDFKASARELRQRVHGLTPWPGVDIAVAGIRVRLRRVQDEAHAGTEVPGTLLAGGRIACGIGALRLIEVQPAGARVMTIDEFLNGHRVPIGTIVGGGAGPVEVRG